MTKWIRTRRLSIKYSLTGWYRHRHLLKCAIFFLWPTNEQTTLEKIERNVASFSTKERKTRHKTKVDNSEHLSVPPAQKAPGYGRTRISGDHHGFLGTGQPITSGYPGAIQRHNLNWVPPPCKWYTHTLEILQGCWSRGHPGPFVGVSQSQFFRDVVNIWR